ncbi:ribokinase [Fopius arisanus]|uniref:Ribokinase n=1 Tax=Fopius arisanus TaxID=64838 RepID=A0A9R1TIK3_9HYME|nr:PREDICTED: ribokinase-like [Fopius arisanus]
MSTSIVVVGSCMIDFTSYSPRLPRPGETLIGTEFKRTVGGKGANQCVSAAKLGGETALVASLGSDIFGEEYLDLLKSHDINTNHVKLRENVSSGIAHITVAENGENSIVIILGANALLSPRDIDEAQETIKKASVLLAQFETGLHATLHALKLYKGCGISIVNGAPAFANPNPEILQNCDIFCVNETEAELMTGIERLTLENAQSALNILFKKGCNTVIITLGASGAVFATKISQGLTHVPVEVVTPVDTTGAGDAFIGALGFFLAYYPQLTLEEQIRRANQVARQSVLKPGTQSSFPTRKQLPEELFL